MTLSFKHLTLSDSNIYSIFLQLEHVLIVIVQSVIHVWSLVIIFMKVLCSLLLNNMDSNKVMILVTRIIAIKHTISVMRWYVLPSTGFNW